MKVIFRSLAVLICAALCTDVYAGPGEGIHFGDLVINPFVEGSYTHDSNVYLDPTNEVDDAYLEGIGGIQFHYNARTFVVEGRLFGQVRKYEELIESDFTDWGESMVFRTGTRESVSVVVDQRFRIVTDYDRSSYVGGALRPEAQNLSLTYDRSTRVERKLHDIGVILGHTASDTVEFDLGVAAGKQDYETNVLFDVEYLEVKAEVGVRVTDKMLLIVNGSVTEEQNESYDGAARSIAVRLGLKRKSTDKLKFNASAGLNRFTRPEEVNDYGREVQETTGRATGSDEPRNDEEAFSFELAGTWLATDKISIELAGHSGIQSAPQYPNTVDFISVGSMSIVYDLSDTLTVSLTGSYRKDDYLDPVVELGQEWQRLDERTAGLARIDYVPPRQFLTVFIEGGYELSESTIPQYNYDQLRLGGGISLRY